MRPNLIKLLIFTGAFILTFSQACGGSAPATSQPTGVGAPTTAVILPPTMTTYPTYTPVPIRTSTPKASPTSVTSLIPTSLATSGTPTPINCIPSITTGFNSCTDNSGSITVDIPVTWVDINGSTWTYKGQDIGFAISAAVDLDEFISNANVEGLFFGASGTFAQIIGHIELLDFYTMTYREFCHYEERVLYNDGIYRGQYDKYSECGGSKGYDAYVLGAREIVEPSTKLILVEIQVFPGDTSVVNHIFDTFLIIF